MQALVYGAINPDLIHYVHRVPQPGDDIRSTSWRLTWGGKAPNAAVALATWGVETILAGQVLGADALGGALLEALQRPNLDLSALSHDPGIATGHCVVLVTPGGERTIVCAGYEDARWQEVSPAHFADLDVLLLDGFAAPAAPALIAAAREAAVPVVWLDAPDPPPTGVELVVWSRHEHSEDAVSRLAASGQNLVTTSGGDPVLAWWGGSFVVTPPAVAVVDATGAGDVFAAACARGVGAGWQPVDIVSWAAAAGAAVAARGRESLPTVSEVEALLQTGTADGE